VIVSNVITVFKYLILQFLPKMLTNLPDRDFGWPGINMTLFGETFKWNILGYDQTHGGLRYFVAYMIAMVIGEAVNFPIQRSLVFRSKGNIWYQALWYLLAFIVITCIRELHQLHLGRCCRKVRARLGLQYRNHSAQRWRQHGDLLLCEQDHLTQKQRKKALLLKYLNIIITEQPFFTPLPCSSAMG